MESAALLAQLRQNKSMEHKLDKLINPGDYPCPACKYKTLLLHGSRCPKCHANIPDTYWIIVEQNLEKERLRQEEQERVRREREAEERRRRAQQEEADRNSADLAGAIFYVVIILFAIGLVAFALFNMTKEQGSGGEPEARVTPKNAQAEENRPPRSVTDLGHPQGKSVGSEKVVCRYVDDEGFVHYTDHYTDACESRTRKQ